MTDEEFERWLDWANDIELDMSDWEAAVTAHATQKRSASWVPMTVPWHVLETEKWGTDGWAS